MSPHFFKKHWPEQELNGLATREVDGQKIILPVWHRVGFEDVRKYSPMLADRIAVKTDKGLRRVVDSLVKTLGAHVQDPHHPIFHSKINEMNVRLKRWRRRRRTNEKRAAEAK